MRKHLVLLLAFLAGSTAMADSPPRAKPAPPTKAARATWKKQMKAGWAKQKQKAWADAVRSFEAALVAIPDEQRALAELGWSAMNAGDFPKARAADDKVIALAIDDKVKARRCRRGDAPARHGQEQRDDPGARRTAQAVVRSRYG